MRHVRCRSSTAHSTRLQYPPLKSDFAQAYLQDIHRYLFRPATAMPGPGRRTVQPRARRWSRIADADMPPRIRALRSKCKHDCHCGGKHHDLDSHRQQLPACEHSRAATPRLSAGSGRWRRRPYRDLPAVREQGHRIGSCRNTHDGSSQGMIGLESNAAVNGVPVWP